MGLIFETEAGTQKIKYCGKRNAKYLKIKTKMKRNNETTATDRAKCAWQIKISHLFYSNPPLNSLFESILPVAL